MRPSPRDEGQRWLEQAADDLKWTRLLAREGGYHLACFLSQQVAEKALKSWRRSPGSSRRDPRQHKDARRLRKRAICLKRQLAHEVRFVALSFTIHLYAVKWCIGKVGVTDLGTH